MPTPVRRHPSPDIDMVTVGEQAISLQFAYTPARYEAITEIPGAVFISKTRSWSCPLVSAPQARRFARLFNVQIDGDLDELAAAVTKSQLELTQLGGAPDAMVWAPHSTPRLVELEELMKPDQRVGLSYALSTRRALLAMDPGTGKTLTALATFEALDAWPAIVVVPSQLLLNWRREAAMWLPERTTRLVIGRSNFPTEEADLTIIGWPNLAHWVKEKALTGYRGFAADESHMAKSPAAARTKAAIKLAKSIPEGGPVLALTGTPITNRPAEYAAQLDMIGVLKRDHGGRSPFVKRYAGAFIDGGGHLNDSGAEVDMMPELHSKLVGTSMVRRKKSSAAPEHQVLIVPGDPKVMVEYRKAEADIAEYMAAKAAEIAAELGLNIASAAVKAKMKAKSAEHIVRISALRRLAALAKHEALDEVIQDRVDAGYKVIVAAHHRDVVESISERHGGLRIYGGMSPAQTEEAKRRFQVPFADSPDTDKTIVLNFQAGGVGHTLTAGNEVVFAELPWTPSEIQQVWSRADRIGQDLQVYVTYVQVEDTIDQTIWALLGDKAQVIDAAVDGKAIDATNSVTGALVAHYLDKALASKPVEKLGHYDGF